MVFLSAPPMINQKEARGGFEEDTNRQFEDDSMSMGLPSKRLHYEMHGSQQIMQMSGFENGHLVQGPLAILNEEAKSAFEENKDLVTAFQ